ncbi:MULTISPECIES: diaminopimelate decarboxylase [Clostridium]|uniref:diaminopimelate decarboxylase n=1 Tax=Clostridium TaxID=1485 RepID=UPI0006526CDA|nr:MULTISPECIES: diaminopimelate decarboxylase [Clostridium]
MKLQNEQFIKERLLLFNNTKEYILDNDRRFSKSDENLLFEGINLNELGKKYSTPFYVYSQKEILRNIDEIKNAFKNHANTKIFYASKACSVMKILNIVKESGICVEVNSIYEVRKCLDVGFTGDQIVFNGVVKKKEELEFAIKNDLYSINVDSFFELDIIEEITNRLQKNANVCVRIEPSVSSPTHPGLVTAFHAKSGIDLEDAENMCKKIINMKYVRLKGLHMHVGDQVPISEPFRKATEIMVKEAARLERVLNYKFDLINVGGGIPVPYKYERGNAQEDYLYGGINSYDFASAIISEVHKWRKDIEICIEPGRKIVSSAAVLLTSISCEKTKTNYDENNNIQDVVDWKFIDAGYSILSDSLHFDWYFYLLNASKTNEKYESLFKVAGPLCDGGDYFHQGVVGEFFALPNNTEVGDVLAFLDAGAYTIESQTVYNNRPRTAVVLINNEGKDELIRREDSYEDMLKCDIY